MVSFLSEVDFHREGVAAAGAAYRVLAFASREPEGSPTVRTFVINMGAEVPQAVAREGEEAGDLSPDAQKHLVFLSPRRDVAGKTAEENPHCIGEE